jgi:hypothetical protein
MVLIVSTLGATDRYPDREMMAKTLRAFLGSLRRQTSGSFRLFLVGHDVPPVSVALLDPWISWISISDGNGGSYVHRRLPESAVEPVAYESTGMADKITDMGLKTYRGVIEAGKWAHRQGLREFWILRMDSDDLLWKGMVEMLLSLDPSKVRAVYNRTCHMYDPTTREIAEKRHPWSTTVNALHYFLSGGGLFEPEWFYHCRDHTTFWQTVRKDKIKAREIDHTLCITTNTGNSISGRPSLELEEGARKIPLTEDLVERYGLDGYA